MFRIFCFFALFFISSLSAKTIEREVFAKKSEITTEMKEEDLLELNGFSQEVTSELESRKLDSALFWNKVASQKGQSKKEELAFLKTFFTNILLSQSVPALSKEVKNVNANSDDDKLSGVLKADFISDKLQESYNELVDPFVETKKRTFYILSTIDLDSNLEWTDIGISKSEYFSGAIVKSWKELFEKELKGFEKIVVLESDFKEKPEYMNAQSVSLKWTSVLKKRAENIEKKTISFELNAQAIIVNTKTGQILKSFDFPLQRKELESQNKKNLSSALASLVYNLIYSERAKIMASIEVADKNQERTQFEAKMVSKSSLSEMLSINNLLQEKFSHIKLTSQTKSFSSEGAILLISAEGSIDKIVDSLSLEGGRFPLNEQKILLFNRLDKSFAILSKDSNNKN